MLLEKLKFLQTSSNGTMYHYRVLHTPWNDLWALQHAKSNGTARSCVDLRPGQQAPYISQ